jgi:ketosteroid isomerase-like protein
MKVKEKGNCALHSINGERPMANLMNRRIDDCVICIILGAFSLLVPELAGAEDKKPAGAEKEVRTVLDDQVVAWNKGDLPGFMAGYWSSKDLTFYSGKDKRQGWEETLQRYKMRYQGEGKEMGTLSFAELDIKLLSDDYALIKGRWQVEMKKEKLDGLFTLIMRKTDKGWKIVHDHTSG